MPLNCHFGVVLTDVRVTRLQIRLRFFDLAQPSCVIDYFVRLTV